MDKGQGEVNPWALRASPSTCRARPTAHDAQRRRFPAWLEYFAGAPNADFFAPATENTKALIVPSVSVYEVFKRVLQHRALRRAPVGGPETADGRQPDTRHRAGAQGGAVDVTPWFKGMANEAGVPTIVQLELAKLFARERIENEAERMITYMQQCVIGHLRYALQGPARRGAPAHAK